MALTRIACPECGAALKSATGFTPGQTVSCTKCETDFVAEEPDEGVEQPRKGRAAAADDEDYKPKKKFDEEDEEGWSYKNSWVRFAVLGVLVVVMCVLAYMLYMKKQREAEDNAARDRGVVTGPATPV